MSRVDVVIPCYNYARFLPQCVSSVITQERVEVRVLIIDDCSTDDTERVGRQMAEHDDRVEFRRHRTNHGHIRTYNEGLLEWAKNDYVLLLSADDMLAPGALGRAADIMNMNPDVAFCHGHQVQFEDSPPQITPGQENCSKYLVVEGAELLNRMCRGGDNPIATPTAVVRTSVQQLVGGYRPELPHTGDLEMWLRLAANGNVGELDAVQAFKREHSCNMAKGFTPTILPDLKQRRRAFESVMEEYADRIEGGDSLLRLAHKALAGHAFWGAHSAFERGHPELCEELLAFALDLDSTWRARPEWLRLYLKR